ncbi:YdeI/OmpD-associated family protein [Cytophagaceae bacterium DM2B3-1]|uniref:YdeI/OmpD-associated family protein n=1 Tax=Xanthocytophaga flava TaxID=3048013 RepID=A0ABT7CTX6_9BACT|nr:YdeI/OmpD-associated family protein [Xanthocytophaga flavus]MDJ1497155.1 YdeI/OmpD-associated family protein [Xanthocytophaga flavus]
MKDDYIPLPDEKMEQNQKVTFAAKIEQHNEMDAGYIAFPYDVQELYGVKGQVKVKALLDGKVLYRGSLANMETGCHRLGMTKAIRKELNKTFGDIVDVEIEKDTEERLVELPEDVIPLLEANPEAKSYFEKLSYTNRKEYIVWIESAKKAETRTQRLTLFIEKLNQHKKYSDK